MPFASIFSMVWTAKAQDAAPFSPQSSAFPAPFLPKTDPSPAPQTGYSSGWPNFYLPKTLWLCGCSLLRKRKLDQSDRFPDVQTGVFSSLVVSSLPVRQAEQHCRCRVKGEHARRQPVFFFDQESLPKSPVAQMDSIKFTDGYCCIFPDKVCCSCNDFKVYFLLSCIVGRSSRACTIPSFHHTHKCPQSCHPLSVDAHPLSCRMCGLFHSLSG